MKNQAITIFLLTFSIYCFGQSKILDIPRYSNKEHTIWMGGEQNDVRGIGLPDLTKSKDSLHFRYSNEKQFIDIWTADYKTFNGFLTNFIEVGTKDKQNKYYKKFNFFDTSGAKQIYNIFNSLSISFT